MAERRDDATVLRAHSRTAVSGKGKGKEDGNAPGQAAVAPKVLKSRFVLDEKLGSGGMGTVYRAKDLRKVEARDRFPYVAIKVLNSDIREHPEAFIALEREASKSQQLSHPNIVSIFDFDKDGNVPFITMELLQGRELADLLHAYPNGLPEDLAESVIRGLCAGLRHAHENGVVHADFKPGNVFVTNQDVAKVLDFGIARAVQVRSDYGEDTVFDPARMAALTPVYASLEMIRGDNPEPRDDIYSLAVVIYMVLTGHHPYGRLPADEALSEGLVPERPRNLPRRQWQVLSRALSFYRQGRPVDMEEFEQAYFGQSAWLSKGLAAASLLLAVFAGSFVLIEGAQIDEVKKEVRETTLLDAQAARVSGFLLEGALSQQAMSAIHDELVRLKELDVSGDYYPALEARFLDRLMEAMRRAEIWSQMVAFYELRRQYGESLTANALFGRARDLEFDRLSRTIQQVENGVEVATRQSRDDLLALRDLIDRLAPELSINERLRSLGVSLGTRALGIARAGDVRLAYEVLALAEPLAPQNEGVAALEALAQEEVLRAEEDQQRARTQRELDAARNALGGSCLRLDPAALPNTVLGATSKEAHRYMDERLAECVQSLSRVDRLQARRLQRGALDRMRWLPAVAAIALDPCLESDDRQCRDHLSAGTGPELVIVPDREGRPRFAVSQEISGEEFLAFCRTQGIECDVRKGALPATGVPLDLVQAYALWLSEESGYNYRLPNESEWLSLAESGEPGTINCGGGFLGGHRLHRTTSGQANPLGVYHLLGNAAELVEGESGVVVAGGSVRSDGDCSPEWRAVLSGAVSDDVGFRLLRELS